MTLTELLQDAIAIAVEAHSGALAMDGEPYIMHPLRLMLATPDPAERIVAVLHDTIEDTDVTLDDLRARGFPDDLLDALDAVTKRDGEDYEAFIERIALNPLAVRVKLLDLRDNIDLTRLPELREKDLARAARYHRAIRRLTQTQVA